MKVLLIPSAMLIPEEMRSLMGNVPACLFPLNGTTMLEHICNQYQGIVDEIFVLVKKEKQLVYDYINLKKLNVNIIEVDELKDLGYSVLCGLRALVNMDIEQVYINFADTLIVDQQNDTPQDIVYFSQQIIDENWSYFRQKDGRILQVIDKQSQDKMEDTCVSKGNVFVGVFELKHAGLFFEKLVEASQEKNGIDTFYLALQRYSESNRMKFVLTDRWFDVGHSDRYLQAKTGVASRSFNYIDIDENRGVLKKVSENHEKLIDEIQWYLKMPNRLQYLVPRIYEYSLDASSPYVSMEYYGYNTLHEMFVFGDIPLTRWRTYFEKILFALKDMRNYRVKCEPEVMYSTLESMYVTKTIERLESLREDENFFDFFNKDIIVNKKQFPNLDRCLELLPNLLLSRLVNSSDDELCIIHGDLCFTNILVEDKFGFLRLIDPRGRFGEFDIYGDQRYELAKLMHSMDGCYDYIIEDMFSISVEGSNIDLRIPEQKRGIYEIFRDVFSEYLKDYENLQLLESMLFLSMIPLHSDSLSRQYAMLATGLRLLAEAMGGSFYE